MITISTEMIFNAACCVIDAILGIGLFNAIFSLAILLPGLAACSRRLHDTGRSAWWILISFIPIVGLIVLIVFLAQKGQTGENRFGPDPKAE